MYLVYDKVGTYVAYLCVCWRWWQIAQWPSHWNIQPCGYTDTHHPYGTPQGCLEMGNTLE